MLLQQLHLVLQIAGVLYGRILQLLHALTDPIFCLQQREAPELAQQLPGVLGPSPRICLCAVQVSVPGLDRLSGTGQLWQFSSF